MLDEGYLDYSLHSDSAYRPYWERVIELNPDQAIIFEKATANIRLLSGNLPEKEVLLQMEKIRQQVKEGTRSNIKEGIFKSEPLVYDSKEKKRYLKSFRAQVFFTIAAVFIISLGIYFLPTVGSKQTLNAPGNITTLYISEPGERRDVKLPDGTIVLLNSNSHITIDKDFGQVARKVKLTGEAFFNVTKDESKPFVVESDAFSTTAIGTSFYVHARNSERQYAVDLVEGKVKLAGYKSVVLLTAGEQGVWDSAITNFSKTSFDRDQLNEWIKGKIVFNKTPLNDAILKLEQWFAIKINVKNKRVKNSIVTGTYVNRSLNDILQVICLSLSCKYKYVDDKVIVE